MQKYLIAALIVLFIVDGNAQQKHYNLLVGTYTNSPSCKSDGIYVYDFDSQSGATQLKASTMSVINPSFITVAADFKNVYCVNENGNQSTVSAFKFDAKSGKLRFENQQDAAGADPCHIITDSKHVIVANYSGGSIAVLGKNADGSLSPAKQIVKHEGRSINKQRQESPHVHQVNFSPDKNWVLANDLGTDRIYLYQYNADAAKEILVFKDSIPIKSGSGPRHLTFHPNGKFVYLLQELDGTLTTFAYLGGKLRRIQESTVVANDFVGENSAADIHISADGKFLYATNRGAANTISTFAVDSKGKLALRQTTDSGGKGPRNFTIDPTGNFVLVAHQYSNDIVIFKRDAVTGMLSDAGKRIALCAPVCLVFTPSE